MDTLKATSDVKITEVATKLPSNAGFTSCVIPETQVIDTESSQIGVSTHYAVESKTKEKHSAAIHPSHWFALRTTYGREKKAFDYLSAHDVEVFLPTLPSVKISGGKRITVLDSRIPNILFAYSTKEELCDFVYDNINLPYLRFYYKRSRIDGKIVNVPLIVPDNQIRSLKIICESEASDIVSADGELQRFKEGQLVRVIDGNFKGVVGRVARYKNHQRVGIIFEGILTVCTAYIPSVFMEIIE